MRESTSKSPPGPSGVTEQKNRAEGQESELESAVQAYLDNEAIKRGDEENWGGKRSDANDLVIDKFLEKATKEQKAEFWDRVEKEVDNE